MKATAAPSNPLPSRKHPPRPNSRRHRSPPSRWPNSRPPSKPLPQNRRRHRPVTTRPPGPQHAPALSTSRSRRDNRSSINSEVSLLERLNEHLVAQKEKPAFKIQNCISRVGLACSGDRHRKHHRSEGDLGSPHLV